MGETIVFGSNGRTAQGYLAAPVQKGPGVVVIQEWWGLVSHIKDVCDRLAAEGFVALAPDLYEGRMTTEPDEASKMMMELDLDRAAQDMAGAVEYLRYNAMVDPVKMGSVGFCMGGALSLVLATLGTIDACVTYYGLPTRKVPFENIRGPVLGHFAEHEEWPKHPEEVFAELRSLGIDAEMHMYPGTHHAFFNDARPEVHHPEAARLSWDRTLDFFRAHLKA